jgi:hypothetical protein
VQGLRFSVQGLGLRVKDFEFCVLDSKEGRGYEFEG